MEEIGYIPWNFSIPDERHDAAWSYLKREDCFRAPWGNYDSAAQLSPVPKYPFAA